MDEQIKKRLDADFARELTECLDWLKDKPLKKNISNTVSIVNIKQEIERRLKTYVSRDAVLEAVKQLGIPNDGFYVALQATWIYQ
jgi:hypothetical protein